MPMATCRATISATACFTCASNSARSYGSSRSFLISSSTSACGRGRLPTCVVRMRSVLSFIIRPPSMPQLRRCQLRSFHERAELSISDLWVYPSRMPDECRKAAIRASHDPLASHDIGELADALRHQFGVFDVVGAGVDHAWDQHLVVRDLGFLPHGPFVCVARI